MPLSPDESTLTQIFMYSLGLREVKHSLAGFLFQRTRSAGFDLNGVCSLFFNFKTSEYMCYVLPYAKETKTTPSSVLVTCKAHSRISMKHSETAVPFCFLIRGQW